MNLHSGGGGTRTNRPDGWPYRRSADRRSQSNRRSDERRTLEDEAEELWNLAKSEVESTARTSPTDLFDAAEQVKRGGERGYRRAKSEFRRQTPDLGSAYSNKKSQITRHGRRGVAGGRSVARTADDALPDRVSKHVDLEGRYSKTVRGASSGANRLLDEGGQWLDRSKHRLSDAKFGMRRRYLEGKHYAKAYEKVLEDEFKDPAKRWARETYAGTKRAGRDLASRGHSWVASGVRSGRDAVTKRVDSAGRHGSNALDRFRGAYDDAAKSVGKYGDGLAKTVGKYGDEVAGVAGKLKTAPGALGAAFYGTEMYGIYDRWKSDEISSREAKIEAARATGGLVGGGIGALAGSSLGPAGTIGGAVVGEYAGRKLAGFAAEQVVGSPDADSSGGHRPPGSPAAHPIRNTSTPNRADRRLEIPADATASASEPSTDPTATEPNRAKANKRQRQQERIVERHVERRPAPTPDVDRKIERAKQDAIREMERRFKARPTPL